MATLRTWLRGALQMQATSYRLFLRYLVIVLIPVVILLVMGLISIVVNQDYVSHRISESNFRSLSQIQDNVEQVFDELDSIALSFSASQEFLNALNEIVTSKQLTFEQSRVLTTIKDFIEVSAYSRPYVQSIYVYTQNKGDEVLTTSDGIIALGNFYDTGWYQDYIHHAKSDTFWTEIRTLRRFVNLEKGQIVVSLFRRVFSLTGTTQPGVVVINIRFDYVTNLVDRLKSDSGQEIRILDANENTLLRVGPDEMASVKLRPLSADGPSHSQYEVRSAGRTYVVNESRSPQNGWTFAALTPLSHFYEASTTLRDINIAIVFVSFLVGALVAFYASKRSFRHIQNVVGIVEAAEKGVPLPKIPEADNGEYSHLTYAILKTFVENEYMRVQLSERKYRERTMELLALHSQMNPHFLFNTLETINWRVIELTRRPNQINDLIARLSDILKYALESPFKLETLENELKHADAYLTIQRVRYKEKFTVERDTPDDIGKYKVIRFLLQPLIENAIYHGIREKEGTGRIIISARKVGETIVVSVEDNGLGIPPERLARIRSSLQEEETFTGSIGLQNTAKRVSLAFGDSYGLEIDSEYGRWTRVTATIPARV